MSEPLKSAKWEDCPHCEFTSSNYGSHLTKYCALHQMIVDLREDLSTSRQIIRDQSLVLAKIAKALGASAEEDDLVQIVEERMEFIREIESTSHDEKEQSS